LLLKTIKNYPEIYKSFEESVDFFFEKDVDQQDYLEEHFGDNPSFLGNMIIVGFIYELIEIPRYFIYYFTCLYLIRSKKLQFVKKFFKK